MSSEISEVVAGQVNERFLEVPTNSTYFADLATLNAAQSGAQNPFDAVVREVVDLRAAAGNMSAFDSRYKPLASDRLWLSAQEFSISVNTPSLGDLGSAGAGNQRTTAWLFDSGVAEAVGGFFMMPVGWATADMFVWWSNAGAGAGDVVWSFGTLTLVNTTNSDAAGTLSSSTITAPAQYVVKRSAGPTAITATAGQVVRLMLRREGANAADTLGNDAGLLGVELVRAS